MLMYCIRIYSSQNVKSNLLNGFADLNHVGFHLYVNVLSFFALGVWEEEEGVHTLQSLPLSELIQQTTNL